MLEITPWLKMDESEIHLDFVRGAGPGGQNVNKVSSAVQVRFDVRRSAALDEEVKARLLRLAGKRASNEGVLIIEARRYRTQEQNRADALRRLTVLIQKALHKPEVRKPTRPGRAAKAARLEEKRKRAEIKRARRAFTDEW